MIEIPLVVTAGGTAELVFKLADKDGNRLTDLPSGIATASFRKRGTKIDEHEIERHSTVFDPIAGTVTVELSPTETLLLGPESTAQYPDSMTAVGDVRLETGSQIEYFGPFTFTVRNPETAAGQPIPTPEPIEGGSAFVKSITTGGFVIYADDDGIERNLQLDISGPTPTPTPEVGQRGVATFWATTQFNPSASRITATVAPVMQGTPQPIDFVYFFLPSNLPDDMSGNAISMTFGGITGDLRDFNNQPVQANQLQPGQLTGWLWSLIGIFVAIEPLPAALPIQRPRWTLIRDDETVPTPAEILAEGTSSMHPRVIDVTPIGSDNSYLWIYDVNILNYIGLSETGGNQFGASTQYDDVVLDGITYHSWRTNSPLINRAFTDFTWYAYTTT